jgi:putative ABC transport system ATP-binding protein
MALVRVEDVSMTFRMGEVDVPVLRGVDLSVEAGEMIVVLGPSGSGKSTLINLIGGIDRPTGGRILFEDEDLASLSDAALTRYRREHVGLIFQLYNLVPTLTAVENVSVATEIAEDPMGPDEALAMVGLGDRAVHFPAQLSGGEQQRVAIARAIAKRPTLLLCDEPTGALDLATGREVLALIRRLADEMGVTVMLVTHNSAIAAMADRVVHLGSGRIERIETNAHPRPAQEVAW